MIEVLVALAKWSPQIVTLIKVLEGGKVTPQEATDTILKLEKAAIEAELAQRYPGEVL